MFLYEEVVFLESESIYFNVQSLMRYKPSVEPSSSRCRFHRVYIGLEIQLYSSYLKIIKLVRLDN